MKVVIAGGSGFLGSALASSLRVDGHQITIITRHPQRRDQAPWTDLPIVATVVASYGLLFAVKDATSVFAVMFAVVVTGWMSV